MFRLGGGLPNCCRSVRGPQRRYGAKRLCRTPGVTRSSFSTGAGVHRRERPAEADDRAVPGRWEGEQPVGHVRHTLIAVGPLPRAATPCSRSSSSGFAVLVPARPGDATSGAASSAAV